MQSEATKLDFTERPLEDFEGFCQQLSTNTVLIELIIEFREIGDTGAQQLAEALKVNFTLQRLFLAENNISNRGAEYLAEALKVNSSLTFLALDCNPIGSEGAFYLAKSLEKNDTLTYLNLSYTDIDATGASYIAAMLQTNVTLTSLSLYVEGNDFATIFAPVFQINSSLLQLRLNCPMLSSFFPTKGPLDEYTERNRWNQIRYLSLQSLLLRTV